MGKVKVWGTLAVLIAVAGTAAWWWQRGAGVRSPAATPAVSGAGPAASAPPVSVTTVVAQQRDWPVQLSASGTVAALNTVEIRAQVASTVTRVAIREGQFVKAGELLFTLDSRADEAAAAKAQAQLERSQAALADAQRQLARSRELFDQKFVSQSAVDSNLTLVDSAQAAVSADRAALAAARVTLGHSRIVAPAAGRAGAIAVYAGSYVQPGSPPLVTITQLDPIAVAFTLPQRDLPDVLAALASGRAPVRATLPDARGSLDGKLVFVDSAVDAASGTVKLKAQFDNARMQLWPGAFVAVQLSPRTLEGAIVLPQAAIVQGANASTVFIVDADGKAAQRKVEVLASAGAEAVVRGVEPGARVIVEGRQNLRPGSTVRERTPEAEGSGGARNGGTRGAPGASAPARPVP